MKKWLVLLSTLLAIPLVSAEECSLLNLAACIPQKLFDFIINIINAPLQPLLSLSKSLLTEPIQTSLFLPIWTIILYVLSLFYGLLLLYSGFNFIISGYDSEKRARAKEWLRNIFIMIVLIQASYFLYSLIIEINSLLTAGIINLIDNSFFLLTADNIINVGLQFFFGLAYVIVLGFSVIFLTLRYVIVAAGIILVPIGIFLYFIPPVKDYGKLILSFLGTCVFLSFFDVIILLVCSRLIEIQLFANFKIIVMITAFSLINFMMFYFMFFSAIKSAFKTVQGVAGPIISIAKYFAA